MLSGRQVDHLTPFSAEVRNEWSCTSIPPVYFQGVYKGRFNFFTCVLYEVKTEYVYLMQIIFSFQGFIAKWISGILWSNIVPDDGGGYCVWNIEILLMLIGW